MSIQSDIRAGLVRAAERTAGAELTATFTRVSGADETQYPPVAGTSTDYTAAVLFTGFSDADRAGMEITSRMAKLLVSSPVVSAAGAEIEPDNGDLVTVSGTQYSVVRVEAIRPGGTALMWNVYLGASLG